MNLTDQNVTARFPLEDHVWLHPETLHPVVYQPNDKITLPPFGSYLLRHLSAKETGIVTDNLHLFPGSSVESLHITDNQISLTFNPQMQIHTGVIWLQVPDGKVYWLNETPLLPEEREGHFWVKYAF